MRGKQGKERHKRKEAAGNQLTVRQPKKPICCIRGTPNGTNDPQLRPGYSADELGSFAPLRRPTGCEMGYLPAKTDTHPQARGMHHHSRPPAAAAMLLHATAPLPCAAAEGPLR